MTEDQPLVDAPPESRLILDPTQLVRETTARVMADPQHVTIDQEALATLAVTIAADPTRMGWDPSDHLRAPWPLFAQYTLVLDALNFCFWTDDGFEYAVLSRKLADLALLEPTEFAARRLRQLDAAGLARWLGRSVWRADERARLVREVGEGLRAFDGQAAMLVEAAEGSARRLVAIIAATFPGFRDHAIHDGRQVFFLKRAQIFVADVWGGARGLNGVGSAADMDDIAALTTFADYRVPQLLRGLGVLRLSDELNARIEAGSEIAAGSVEEIEIRAATVQAVERLCVALRDHGTAFMPIEVDWWLWHRGEAQRSTLPAHHRTRTIYY